MLFAGLIQGVAWAVSGRPRHRKPTRYLYDFYQVYTYLYYNVLTYRKVLDLLVFKLDIEKGFGYRVFWMHN